MNTLIFSADAIDADRFARFLNRTPDGCIEWLGKRDRDGYGCFSYTVDGRQHDVRSHRVAWVLAGNTLAPGMVIDHLCRNRSCCEPTHLDLVTPRVNTARGTGPTAAAVRARTAGQCVNGHDIATVGVHSAGGRRPTCAECGRQRVARYQAKRRAA